LTVVDHGGLLLFLQLTDHCYVQLVFFYDLLHLNFSVKCCIAVIFQINCCKLWLLVDSDAFIYSACIFLFGCQFLLRFLLCFLLILCWSVVLSSYGCSMLHEVLEPGGMGALKQTFVDGWRLVNDH